MVCMIAFDPPMQLESSFKKAAEPEKCPPKHHILL